MITTRVRLKALHRRPTHPAFIFVLTVWLGLLLFQANGQIVNSWTNTGSGFWETPANWSAGAPASSQSLVQITNAPTKVVHLYDGGVADAVKAVSNLVVSAPSGNTNTLLIDTITSGINQLQILNGLGVRSGGELVLNTFVTNRVDGGAGGGLDVDGSLRVIDGVLVTSNTFAHIGSAGKGSLLVQNGTWRARDVSLGYLLGASGTITQAGGNIQLAGELRIAPANTSTGAVYLYGGQMTATNASVYAGLYANGYGTFTTTNGVFQARDLYVGYYGGSQGRIELYNGTNFVANSLVIGDSLGATGRVWSYGGWLLVTNAAGNAQTVVGHNGYGELMLFNGNAEIDRLLVTNGANSRFTFYRSTLKTRSVISSNSISLDGGAWDIRGGPVQFPQLNISQGMGGSTTAVTIADAPVTGRFSLGTGGEAWLTLTNCTWTNADAMVGYPGSAASSWLRMFNTTATGPGISVGSSWYADAYIADSRLTLNLLSLGDAGSSTSFGSGTLSNVVFQANELSIAQFGPNIANLGLVDCVGTVTTQVMVNIPSGSHGTLSILRGRLAVTNTSGTARLVLGGIGYNYMQGPGFVSLSDGTLLADRLIVTNPYSEYSRLDTRAGFFFRSGTLQTRNASFYAGDDVVLGATNESMASWTMLDGLHTFDYAGLGIARGRGSSASVSVFGATLVTTNAAVCVGDGGNGQMVLFNGTWQARDIIVGNTNAGSGLLTLSGGLVTVSSNLVLGNLGCGGLGWLSVAGGQLRVTNANHDATLDVRGGTFDLSSGIVDVDRLVLTNTCGLIHRTGGSLTYRTLVLAPNLSATGDGLPNGWKQKYGLDPLSSSGNNAPGADPDKDGMTNLQEYQAGTNPTNAASCLRITNIRRVNNDIQITWTTAGPHTNWVQAAASGSSITNDFRDLSAVPLPNPQDYTITSWDVGVATNRPARYYRIRVEP